MNKFVESTKLAIATFILFFMILSTIVIILYSLEEKSYDKQYILSRYCAELDETCAASCRQGLNSYCEDCCYGWDTKRIPVSNYINDKIIGIMTGSTMIAILLFFFSLFSNNSNRTSDEH